nr:gliding motility-associated C-terminal domain-containing protein [Saprospiraceae bacterium]
MHNRIDIVKATLRLNHTYPTYRLVKFRYFIMRSFLFYLFGPLIALVAIDISTAYATHNRGGEIAIEQTGDLTVRAIVTTYTKASSVAADRDSITINWGDGQSSVVQRVNGNGNGVEIGNDLQVNLYVGEHTYPGRGTYIISMTDPNRIAGIQNINFPNSDLVLFYIETKFTFLNPQFQGYNNSVVLLNPPVDFACVGERFIHNPNAYDPDGDSLSFHLIESLEASGEPVPRYEFPDQIIPGLDNQISMDPVTGDFVWDAPQLRGEYNIAIKINEYRNGNIISTTIRDMQINVRDNCQTTPPQISSTDELCVIAGDTIVETIIAEDQDPGQLVKLRADGGPLELNISPARFEVPRSYQNPPVQGTFIWETSCNHIRNQFYQVIFKAEDNAFSTSGLGDTSGLVDLKNLAITVSGPSPENLTSISRLDGIDLRWDKPYACEETLDDYFNGFTVWRRNTSTEVAIDTCGTDLSESGYVPIGFGIKSSEGDQYLFTDQTAEQAVQYCYRITAEFARRGGVGNNPFNRVQSLPSNEACAQLALDIPLIIEASVESTDEEEGAVSITWTKPLIPDFDSLSFPGPYTYKVFRSVGIGNEEFIEIPGGTFNSNTFAMANDTSFTDTALNTVSDAYTYRISFYTGADQEEYGRSPRASTVFLTSNSRNKTNIIDWEKDVPWINDFFDVFLLDDSGQITDTLSRETQSPFIHTGLINDTEYCYLVRSTGSYYLDGIGEPIINFSQILCATPLDTIPPCPPLLEVENICTHPEQYSGADLENLENKLIWESGECDFFEGDTERFLIYYSGEENKELEWIDEVAGHVFSYTHQSDFGVTGCYAVRAVDTTGNISEFSNRICKSNCPIYNLPNAFTPNGDGHNDLFIPFSPYIFVERVDFEVYNRWGQRVFRTDDPDLNWDGTNFSGTPLAEGTYHYTAKVYYIDLSGSEVYFQLRGFIELIR